MFTIHRQKNIVVSLQETTYKFTQVAIVVRESQRFYLPACLSLMADNVGHFSTVTASAYDDYSFQPIQAPLRKFPVNSSAVACPGWLMPSRLTIFENVSAMIFKSSQKDW